MPIKTCQINPFQMRLSARSRSQGPGISRSKIGSWLLTFVLLSGLAEGRVHSQAPDEYQMKAAFLYNFARFVEWPSETLKGENPILVVGIMGSDPFGTAVDESISSKSLNGRQFMIKRLKWGQNLRDCHILVICASERKRLSQILESLKGAGVLTVSELSDFCQQGGGIGLILEEKKVRFLINMDAAEQARLKISSKLLTLAKAVLGERRLGRN